MWSNLICGEPERAARLQANRTRPCAARLLQQLPQRLPSARAQVLLKSQHHWCRFSLLPAGKKQDCHDLRARPTPNFHHGTENGHFWSAFGSSVGLRGLVGCTDVPAVCLWGRRITRFASICSGKRGGAANTHRRGAEGAVPAAGQDAPLIPAFRVFAFTRHVQLLWDCSCGFVRVWIG